MPSLKAREVLTILFSQGFEKVRTSGSHIRLRKGNSLVTVPYHASKNIPMGTLNLIIKQSGLLKEHFTGKKRKK